MKAVVQQALAAMLASLLPGASNISPCATYYGVQHLAYAGEAWWQPT
jgi:hypothetical protein